MLSVRLFIFYDKLLQVPHAADDISAYELYLGFQPVWILAHSLNTYTVCIFLNIVLKHSIMRQHLIRD